MRREFAIALLVAAALPAQAAWERLGETPNVDIYFDPATISGSGATRTVWVLNDRKQSAEDGEKSRRVQIEYDCPGRRWRTVGMTTHAEPMGRGREMSIDRTQGEWRELPTQGGSARVYGVVCTDGKAR